MSEASPSSSPPHSHYAALNGSAAEQAREALSGIAKMFPQAAASPVYVEEAQKLEYFKNAMIGSLLSNPGAAIPTGIIDATMAYTSAVRLQLQLLAQAGTPARLTKTVSAGGPVQKRA